MIFFRIGRYNQFFIFNRKYRNKVCDLNDDEILNKRHRKTSKPSPSAKKDTGYSTASSHTSKSTDEKYRTRINSKHQSKGSRRELRDDSDDEDVYRKHTDKHKQINKRKQQKRKSSDSKEIW